MNPPEKKMSATTLEILVNGDRHTLADPVTMDQLLVHLAIGNPAIAVEVNEQLVVRAEYPRTRLRAGDRVEIVTLTGGG